MDTLEEYINTIYYKDNVVFYNYYNWEDSFLAGYLFAKHGKGITKEVVNKKIRPALDKLAGRETAKIAKMW